MKPEVDEAGHGKGASLQHCVYQVQRKGAEHEHELQGLRDTCKKYSQHSGDKHGTVIAALIRIHTAVHGQGNAQKEPCGANHLSDLETGRGDGGHQILVSRHVARVFKIDEVSCPGQPQRILSKDLGTRVDACKDGVSASEGGIIHGYGQHMVQAEGEEQPLQCSVDKGGQHRRGGGGVGNPYAERVDAGLNHGPDDGQRQGDDDGPEDDHHGHEAFAVKKGQGIRQFPVIIIFIVNDSACKA